jgi:PiT family inorganic phosphate transporter
MDTHLLLVVLAVLGGAYMAWTIGANDVGNAFGTSVGSKAITLLHAVLIAAVFEFAGSFLVGAHVAQTISGSIIDNHVIALEAHQLAVGMIAALIGSSLWLHFATHLGWPVSTSHAIVGAVIGLGIAMGGLAAVRWDTVGPIALSWLISPVGGALLAIAAYWGLVMPVYRSRHPVRRIRVMAPLAAGIVFFMIVLSVVFKGLENLHLDLPLLPALGAALAAAFLAWAGARFLLARRRLHEDAADFSEFKQAEPVFAVLQIITACYMSFAHGANDVANAIGPLATVVSILKTGVIVDKVPVPPALLALGGLGIVIGLATLGYRVIVTIGRKITTITPSRGFSAELGCATTVLVCSKLGLPVSTTHTIVGAVVGVGLVHGIKALDMRILRDIGGSWIATIPASALLTVMLYWALAGLI